MTRTSKVLRLRGTSLVPQPWINYPMVSYSGSSRTDQKIPRCFHFQTCRITKFGNWCIIYEPSESSEMPRILPELAQKSMINLWRIYPISTANLFLPASFAWFIPPFPWVYPFSDNEYLAHLHLAFFHPYFFRHLDNRLPPFYSYCRIRNILPAKRHDNCIINLIEKVNIMNLVTFNPKQALDSFFDTD